MEETVKQETTETTETKTFTQEEVNRIVGERVAREAGKYSDYEDLKAKATKYDEMEEANKTELEKAQERASELEAELKSIMDAEAVRVMREKVSEETGGPANLITATSEEEAMEQANAIKQYATPTYPKVMDSGEAHSVSAVKTREQFAEWFKNQSSN
jgi:hypothetical protein